MLGDAVVALRAGRPYATLTDVEPPWTMTFSASPGARFHVVIQGTCDVVRAGAPTVTLGSGDAVVFPHGSAHRLQSANRMHLELVCGAYQLDRARAHPLVDDLPSSLLVQRARSGRGGVERAVAVLREELTDQEPGHEIAVPALLDVVMIRLIRAWADGPDGGRPGWRAGFDDPMIAPALRAMHARPEQPWTVGSLGAQAGLSRSAFARRFTEVLGQPPLTYLTWWRLTTGARLLRTTDSPLTVVAGQTGYGSPYAFANAFKRQYGFSPGQYRRRQRSDRDHIGDWATADPQDVPGHRLDHRAGVIMAGVPGGVAEQRLV